MQIAAVCADGASDVASSREKNLRLSVAAHQFEASLMQELLRPTTSKGSLFSGGDDDGGGSSDDALAGFGSEALAQAISNRGGLGIANEILTNLKKRPAD